ncbi:hypothetical protein LPB72_00555 [Hydrogenophaga crassostreae]|jgi:hypothetical protein|uniref:Uncharacterized protein n=2 Tax=Hydrogenophaga TaxID=47420 RepID=A0A162SXZ5_9BURK|nr:hypothetical protein [Hydrogenophaga crassostreae]AOW13992.1 hypothetical protein LPB072_15265 [Hydrogenophaga crassostreae]OAD44043.1 hypothetical protein LPB72_00555 [Hydrogenophaga crassostreae]
MSDSTFFVSKAALRNLKHSAQHRVSGVPSAHLSEALASALGFRTYAALRAALDGRVTVEVPKPSNARMVRRLQELGYNAMPDLRLVPEFEHSYSPFRNFPLSKKRSVRWMGWRNLMVAAINAGLEQRLFGLEPSDNWWPGGNPHSQLCKRHVYRVEIEDGHTAVASVNAISGDELSINVVLDPRHEGIEPDRFNGLRDGDAHAHAWVERRLGAWVQDGGEDFSCKRAVQPWLAQLKIDTKGYSDQGSFFM